MSDLVGNPEYRFLRDAAHMLLTNMKSSFLNYSSEVTSTIIKHGHDSYVDQRQQYQKIRRYKGHLWTLLC